MFIKPELLNIAATFGQDKYSIPKFQRNFAWEKPQYIALWDDISNNLGDEYFLGSIIVIPSELENGLFDIIDGQQRLTSIQILLCCIRDTWEAKGNPTYTFKGYPQKRTSRSQELIFKTGTNPGFRFTSNYYLQNIFIDFVQLEKSSPKRKYFSQNKISDSNDAIRAKKLIDAYNFFNEKIQTLENDTALEKLESHLIDNVHMLRITAGTTADAYILFETLNDRGLELAPSDLVKTYLLSQLEQTSNNIDQVAQQWDEMTSMLKGTDTTNFLRHYLLLEKSKVRKSDIFKGFKDKLKTKEITPKDLIDELLGMANLYALITRGEKFDRDTDLDSLFDSLDSIDVDTHRVFLLAILKVFGAKKQDRAKLEKAAQIAEILSFRWTICGLNAQTLESIYQKASAELIKGDSKAYSNSLKILIDKIPSDKDFENNFITHEIRSSKVSGYALRKIELYKNPSLSMDLKSRQKLHVEHIAPKKPATSSNWRQALKGEELYDDLVCRWGNLTLLPAPLNIGIRNSEIKEKVKKGYLVEKDISLTEMLHKIKSWKLKDIEERSGYLAKLAIEVWNKKKIQI